MFYFLQHHLSGLRPLVVDEGKVPSEHRQAATVQGLHLRRCGESGPTGLAGEELLGLALCLNEKSSRARVLKKTPLSVYVKKINALVRSLGLPNVFHIVSLFEAKMSYTIRILQNSKQ